MLLIQKWMMHYLRKRSWVVYYLEPYATDPIGYFKDRAEKTEEDNQRLRGLLERCGEQLVIIDNLMPECWKDAEDLIVDIVKELIDD
jgi:hypothetical protein